MLYKRNLLLVFSLLLSTSALRAQNLKVAYGDTVHVNDDYDVTVFAKDSNSFYATSLHWAARGYIGGIRRYSNKTAKLIYETNITSDDKLFRSGKAKEILLGGGYLMKHQGYADGKLLSFVEFYKGTNSKLVLFQYDAADGKQIGEPLILEEISSEGYDPTAVSEKNRGQVTIRITYTPDKTKMMVIVEKKKNNTLQDVTAKLYRVKDLSCL